MTIGTADYDGTVIVIPTRNRSSIAMNAIRSVLDQPVDQVQFLVSDNSTSEREREDLANFCNGLADPRLNYVRPPQPLSMPSHWEWAIQYALAFYQVSHFIYLTDRMMFRKCALKEVVDLARVYPDKVISYNHDRIDDTVRPIRVDEYAGSEKLLVVPTVRFSYLYSQAILHHGLPRMLNCVAPRSTFDRMRQRFGTVFSSIAPDFLFCCRCLEIEDTILFYDRSPIFHYALNRSNGASVSRGQMTSDNADFTANLPVDSSKRNYATPIPELNTAVNAVFNEYLIFKQETNSPRFFDVDFEKYLDANAQEIREVADPELRARMLALVVAKGYEATPADQPAASSSFANMSRLIGGRRRFKSAVSRIAGRPTKPPSSILARIFGVNSSIEGQTEFPDVDTAIAYLQNESRGNFTTWRGQQDLLLARELPIPGKTTQ